MTKRKIELKILLKLVHELEASLASAEALSADKDKINYIVEMSKATGLAAGIMSEAGLLMGDCQNAAVEVNKGPAVQSDLEKLLGTLKGPGTTN